MPGTIGVPSTARTSVSSTWRFSGAVSVAPSPSEPRGTRPLQPCATSQRACSARYPWSTLRSAWNGVVIAGSTPLQLSIACSGIAVGPQGGQVERGRLVAQQLRHELAADGSQADAHHRVASGGREVREAREAAEVGQAVGGAGAQAAPGGHVQLAGVE